MLLKELLSHLSPLPDDYEVCFLGVMVADHEQYLFVEKVDVDHEHKTVYLC
jgi:hypothetical protein